MYVFGQKLRLKSIQLIHKKDVFLRIHHHFKSWLGHIMSGYRC